MMGKELASTRQESNGERIDRAINGGEKNKESVYSIYLTSSFEYGGIFCHFGAGMEAQQLKDQKNWLKEPEEGRFRLLGSPRRGG